jgi:hypothetical protein
MSNEQEENEEGDGVGAKTRTKDRSPNYPVMDLGRAIEKVTILHGEFGRHEIPVKLAYQRCGYKSRGAGSQCIAALKAYGLVNVTGRSNDRKVTVSGEGSRIIRNAPNRAVLLKAAALKPPIYKELLDRYHDKGGVPVDELLKQYLVWDRPEPRFNERSVGGFIADFRATLKLANLSVADIINDEEEDDGEQEEHETLVPPKPGDYVQWTSQGVDRFEDSQTGLPMTELAVQDAPTCAQAPLPAKVIATPPVNPFFQSRVGGAAAVGQAKASMVGETIGDGPFISFPLPGGNVIEIRLRNKVTPAGFDQIKQLVELSKSSLVEEEGPKAPPPIG